MEQQLIRMHLCKGDLVLIPKGLSHRMLLPLATQEGGSGQQGNGGGDVVKFKQFVTKDWQDEMLTAYPCNPSSLKQEDATAQSLFKSYLRITDGVTRSSTKKRQPWPICKRRVTMTKARTKTTPVNNNNNNNNNNNDDDDDGDDDDDDDEDSELKTDSTQTQTSSAMATATYQDSKKEFHSFNGKGYVLGGRAGALANYPHMRECNGMLHISGTSSRRPDNTHIGAVKDSSTGEWKYDIRLQTQAVLENIKVMMSQAGVGLEHLLQVTVNYYLLLLLVLIFFFF
ncbi:hypothetical protein RFI_15758 [Reticulomyxa filosa]|uniref:Uncharacterized protein n=1 Tax=Reticulomyxa filosa TaxID=46433 RepID=X6N616_RETFI|nr:hypothetical protein RFI_15758 [Reticulomyxa filosa]|eukprot:ETO21446.1 hypothetical protein RFI_15758 [Reticulomyxa filosa]